MPGNAWRTQVRSTIKGKRPAAIIDVDHLQLAFHSRHVLDIFILDKQLFSGSSAINKSASHSTTNLETIFQNVDCI